MLIQQALNFGFILKIPDKIRHVDFRCSINYTHRMKNLKNICLRSTFEYQIGVFNYDSFPFDRLCKSLLTTFIDKKQLLIIKYVCLKQKQKKCGHTQFWITICNFDKFTRVHCL